VSKFCLQTAVALLYFTCVALLYSLFSNDQELEVSDTTGDAIKAFADTKNIFETYNEKC